MSKYSLVLTRISYVFGIPLVGLVIISVGAFFGFGAIFSVLNINTGTEAVTASFGALFVILSTKFLMQQESQATLLAEKRRAVFEENLSAYKEFAGSIVSILESNKITISQLNQVRQRHALLILIANSDTIHASRSFLNKCLDVISIEMTAAEQELDDGSDLEVNLTPSQQVELWALGLDILNACRQGLSLPNDDFSIDAEKQQFSAIVEKLQIAKNIEADVIKRARQAIPGGLEGWLAQQNASDVQKEKVTKLVHSLEETGKLQSKATNSCITLSNVGTGKSQVVLYIDRVRNAQIFMHFAQKPENEGRQVWEELQKNLTIADGVVSTKNLSNGKNLRKYFLRLSVDTDKHTVEEISNELVEGANFFRDRFLLK